jgi:hypothetical protein
MKNKRYSKMMSIVSLAIAMATLLWLAPPATLCYAQGYGYGAGGGAIVVPAYPGFTSLINKIDTAGVITEIVTAKSSDNLTQLTINKGTKALDKTGKPLDGIIMVEMKKPPAPPTNVSVIGLTYDCGPEDSTFSPPITITFTYDPDKIPKGANEKALVIAIWDKVAGKWVELTGCTVNPTTHTISAPVSHFTAFTILVPSRPAAFSVGALSISPTEADIGESVTISFVVTNTGDLTDSYTVTLKIDDITVATQVLTLAGGGSETLTFDTAKDVVGTHTVNVNGLSDTFTVRAAALPPTPAAFTTGTLTISPKEVDIAQTVTISVVVTNTGDLTGSYEVTLKIDDVVVETKKVTLAGGASQTVSFTTAQDVAGTYTVNVNGLSGTITVRTPRAVIPKAGVPWWVIGAIVAAVIIIGGLLAYFLWWKRRKPGEEEEEE